MKIVNGLQTVVETPEYIRRSKMCIDVSSNNEFINYIAANPKAGKIITGTGGARKIRWTNGNNKGKRSGVRVVYYYHNHSMPIFLFTVYPKSEKDNLTDAECNALRLIIKEIVNAYED